MAHGAGQEAAGSSTGSCCCTASCLEGPSAAHQVRPAHNFFYFFGKLRQHRAFARDQISNLILDSQSACMCVVRLLHDTCG
jgi:hypothetical protein